MTTQEKIEQINQYIADHSLSSIGFADMGTTLLIDQRALLAEANKENKQLSEQCIQLGNDLAHANRRIVELEATKNITMAVISNELLKNAEYTKQIADKIHNQIINDVEDELINSVTNYIKQNCEISLNIR